MDRQLRQDLEALLFVADEPVPEDVLAEAAERDIDEVADALEALAATFESERRGLAVRQVAGGWRLYTAPVTHGTVERYVAERRNVRLTRAALETLAVVAYKQPISRQGIGDIRGVDADAAVRTLVARDLVEEVGRAEGPGRAILYGTTSRMLEQLGLDSLDDLPPLTDFLPEEPAPDEPAPGDHRTARERLQEGLDLPSSAPAGDGRGDGGGPLPPVQPRPAPTHEDMDALSDALERVARSAIDQLREAEDATESDPPEIDAAEADPGEVEPGEVEPEEPAGDPPRSGADSTS